MSLDNLIKKMNVLAKTDRLERSIASTMQAITADRIFTQGKDASNQQIGEYSEAYLKQRVKKGYPRSKKVILQAERDMVNDWSVIVSGKSLGLGFKRSGNADKSEWVEQTYKKDIFKHTKQELDIIDRIIQRELNRLFGG